MTLAVAHVTVNTADARALATWWSEALGGEVVDEHDGWFVLVRQGGAGAVTLAFQKVDSPAPGGRVHLDITASDLEAELDRLGVLGATVVDRRGEPGVFEWVVLTDPDGNEFCVSGQH